jgi:predicted HTH domain antitoxin
MRPQGWGSANPRRIRYLGRMSSAARIIEIPVELPWDRPSEPDVGAMSRELRLLWIIEEVRGRRLGVGKGAELAGVPRAAFMQILGNHGVPVIDYTVEDLERELQVLGIG